jgi:hypothetical protein
MDMRSLFSFNPLTIIDEYTRQSNLYGTDGDYSSLTLFSLHAPYQFQHPALTGALLQRF